MTRLVRLLVVLALLVPTSVQAQGPTVQLATRGTAGTIGANGQAVTLTNTGGLASVLIQTSGTFSLTWELQCAADDAGTVFDADDEIPVTLVSASPTPADSVSGTNAGLYTANIPGCTAVKVIATAYTSGSMGVTIQAITPGGGSAGGGGGGGGAVTGTGSAGSPATGVVTVQGITSGTSVNVACTSGCSSSAGGVLSTNNSSSSNLSGGAAFTGTGEETTGYAAIQVSVYASHASATNGLSLQQSSDNSNWDIVDTFTVAATTATVVSLPAQARYFRLVYTNGATLTTSLRIQTIFKASGAKGSAQRPADAMSNENDYEQILGHTMLFNGTTWDRARSVNTGVQQVAPSFAGTVASTGTGASGAQTQRVVTATDSTIGTVTTVSTVTNLAQLAGTAITMNAGNAAGGTQRVVLASDQAQFGGAAAAAADNTANPTMGGLRTFLHIFDGSTWDRWTGAVSVSGEVDITPASPAAGTYLPVRLSDGSNFLTPSSDATHGSAASSTGPQAQLEATTSLGSDTAVADGNATRAKGDINGRQIQVIGCNRESRVRGQATITDGSSTSVLAAQGANIITEIYAIEIANTSGTDVSVDIRDGTAGSVLWTLMAPATTDTGGGNNRVFNVPLTFTANTAVAADPSASASSIIVSVLGCAVK